MNKFGPSELAQYLAAPHVHLELISAYVSECFKRIQKDIPTLLNPSLLLLLLVLSLRSSRRGGGRSVRRNAALSSKAHRHSSPLVHRAKRRISVFLPPLPSATSHSPYTASYLCPFAVPPIRLLEKWTPRENQMAEFA